MTEPAEVRASAAPGRFPCFLKFHNNYYANRVPTRLEGLRRIALRKSEPNRLIAWVDDRNELVAAAPWREVVGVVGFEIAGRLALPGKDRERQAQGPWRRRSPVRPEDMRGVVSIGYRASNKTRGPCPELRR
jgi:hypothetical protein